MRMDLLFGAGILPKRRVGRGKRLQKEDYRDRLWNMLETSRYIPLNYQVRL